jgi:hypothetical protein
MEPVIVDLWCHQVTAGLSELQEAMALGMATLTEGGRPDSRALQRWVLAMQIGWFWVLLLAPKTK